MQPIASRPLSMKMRCASSMSGSTPEIDGAPRHPSAVWKSKRRSYNLKEWPMNESNLPRHIVTRFERRWATRLAEKAATAWKQGKTLRRTNHLVAGTTGT